MNKPCILIIAAQGLGRFVSALGAIAAIRAHHRGAEIVLLTTPSTAAFAAATPYCDHIWTDDVRGKWDAHRLWRLRRKLRAQTFERVYDLDASANSARIFWLMYGSQGLPGRRKHLAWSGNIKNTALAHGNAHWKAMHFVDRWSAQLAAAGIPGVLRPDLSWVARGVQSFNVPFRMNEPFVLMALDSGPGSPWPARRYAELAHGLADDGLMPVLVGFDVPADTTTEVMRACQTAVDLTNRIAPDSLVFMSWAAGAAVGPDNDTLHLTAAAACHSVVLYDSSSDPALVGQRGESTVILRRSRLADISTGEVMTAIRKSSKIGGI